MPKTKCACQINDCANFNCDELIFKAADDSVPLEELGSEMCHRWCRSRISAFCGVFLLPCCLASAGSGRSHRWGDGEEDSGANPGSLRPAGCAGQQRRDPGHGQHWDVWPGSVRQGHEHQREVGFCPTTELTGTLDAKYEAKKTLRGTVEAQVWKSVHDYYRTQRDLPKKNVNHCFEAIFFCNKLSTLQFETDCGFRPWTAAKVACL